VSLVATPSRIARFRRSLNREIRGSRTPYPLAVSTDSQREPTHTPQVTPGGVTRDHVAPGSVTEKEQQFVIHAVQTAVRMLRALNAGPSSRHCGELLSGPLESEVLARLESPCGLLTGV